MMRSSYVLCFLLAALSVPAAAADLKQEVDKISSTYVERFNKQDAAGIAALFAKGGLFVNPMGAHTNVAQTLEGTFKAGLTHLEATVDQVSPIGGDAGIGLGEVTLSGKNQSGEPLKVAFRFTAVYVLEDGAWKIRMLTSLPKAPPPK